MTSVKVRTPGGVAKGVVELPGAVFDVEPNIPLMHQVVVAQLAAARAGTHSTKTRGQVRGGGGKPYRQKGTGRARQGSIRAPQFAGGGVVHGPTPRDYSQRTPKKMKAAALRGALSDRARAGRVHVVSAVLEAGAPSTKAAREVIAAITELPRVLVVLDREDEIGWLSLRNLPNVHLIAPDQLNTYDVLVNDEIVFSTAGLEAFLAAPAREPAEAAVDEPTELPAGDGPFGPGSHAPPADGSQPEGYPIKGNASSKFYHVPGSGFYKRTAAEVWFDSAESAEAAGFQLPPSQRQQTSGQQTSGQQTSGQQTSGQQTSGQSSGEEAAT